MSGLLKVLSILKSVVAWLNGKKTWLALVAIALQQLSGVFQQIANDTFTPDLNGVTKLVAYVGLLVGVLHKLAKGS